MSTTRSVIKTIIGLVCSFSCAAAPALSEAESLSGDWSAILGDGPGKLRLLINLEQSGDGSYSGEMNSIDQGAKLPIESASVSNDQVKFEVKSVGGVFQGTVNKNFSRLSGTWTQNGAPAQALSFNRGSSSKHSNASRKTTKTSKSTERPFAVPLIVRSHSSAYPFVSGGKTQIVYELELSNFGESELVLDKIEAITGDDAQVLATFSGKTLGSMIKHAGETKNGDARTLAAGQSAIVFMWIASDLPPSKLPQTIKHKLSCYVGKYTEALSMTAAPLTIINEEPVHIANPLTGEDWFAGNGPANSSVHRRAAIPLDGNLFIGQRFAIDWIQQFPDGNTYKGDRLNNRSYLAYGKELLAVADGTVSRVMDGVQENVPGSRAQKITLENVCGNFVILDIGQGRFAFYAHMQPGSVRVKLGDRVKQGQVLGLLGNSGNSSEPHLHFHICNANSALSSEGLPYVCDYELMGKEKGSKTPKSQIPMENEKVSFPAK